jgi:hypothetical protein
MATFNVSNATELKSAIASAVGGDRIVLADANYGKVYITNRAYSSTVSIEAANPGSSAHLDGLIVSGSKNLNIVGLDIGRALNAGEPTYTQLSSVSNSTNIKLDGVHVHGSVDGNPANDGVGLTVTNVAGFSISDSRFEDLYRGIVLQKSSNATIQNNEITMIRSDGIISTANDGLAILGNHIGEFRPNLGDHADAIQFWNTGQTKGQTNITIKDNVIFQTYFSGVEGTGIQGIFMSDPLTYGYKNVLIENNVLYSNDAYNGIYVNGATGVQVLDNTVLSKSSDSKTFWIKLQDSSHVALIDNVTDNIITQNLTGYFQSGNTNFAVNPAARAELGNLLDPTSVLDLIAPSTGYQLPTTMPTSPVSGAVGSSIGSMLGRVGNASVGHTAAVQDTAASHSLPSLSTSPTLDLTAVKSSIVSARPLVEDTHVAAAPEFGHGSPFHPVSHVFMDHFIAIP